MKTTTFLLKNSRNRSSWPLALLLIPLALACFALSSTARAVCQRGCGSTNFSTFLGDDALINNTTGTANTALGWHALYSNTTGQNNTAVGTALVSNTTGNINTAVGGSALVANTTGDNNVACGITALYNNTDGTGNVAVGGSAMLHNTIGDGNTAIGPYALQGNTTGDQNTAVGNSAIGGNTTGQYNTAVGAGALAANATGNNNIAIGDFAGNTATAGNSNIDIGNSGAATDSGVIRIGEAGTHTATFIAGISDTPLATGVRVAITADGQLGVKPSATRFKEAIKPMDTASEAIFALKPVTFHYKKSLDPNGLPQFGLVADEVAKVDPDLVVSDKQGKPFTVRYEEVNAMLLNEFLKEHKKVEQLQATVTQQQKDFQAAIATLRQTVTAQLNGQAAQIQKLSAQLELSKPLPQTIANNQYRKEINP